MEFRGIILYVIFCISIVNVFGQNRVDTLLSPLEEKEDTRVLYLSDFELKAQIIDGESHLLLSSETPDGLVEFTFQTANSKKDVKVLRFKNGHASIAYPFPERGALLFIQQQKGYDKVNKIYHLSQSRDQLNVRELPLWLSIVPPLIAILLALIFKEVISALFAGIFAGAFIANGLSITNVLHSAWQVIDHYIVTALNSRGHLSVIIFSLLIGGMVALISRNGGMAGVVNALSRYARSARSSQLITLILGVAIFFDDYANTLIVGNTMRSVTDRFKISREKLAYIVDSTAAPVSAIAFITTWIGAELGYIQSGIISLEGFDTSISPYALFISSLKYSFYPILTLLFIPIIIYTRRDYGPMLQAEIRASTTGRLKNPSTAGTTTEDLEDLSPVAGAPLVWYHAAIPVLTVILVTIYGLVYTGMEKIYAKINAREVVLDHQNWSSIWQNMDALIDTGELSFFMKMGQLIGASDSYTALLWASSSGVAMALFFTLRNRIMNLTQAMHTLTTGFKTMLPALIILTLAWALAITTKELHTADFLTAILQDSLSPYAMPVIIFILAALIAFSTGSSWSTMAILYPIALPTTWAICLVNQLDPAISMELLLNVIAVVLAAAVLGDHCSPISDTTILSSLASDCNHIDHVRTQMPYALTVGLFSILCGGLSTYLGGGWGISIALVVVSVVLLYLIVLRFGKRHVSR